MAYTLGNKCAKNLCKRTVLVQFIIENVVTGFFLRHCRSCGFTSVAQDSSSRPNFMRQITGITPIACADRGSGVRETWLRFLHGSTLPVSWTRISANLSLCHLLSCVGKYRSVHLLSFVTSSVLTGVLRRMLPNSGKHRKHISLSEVSVVRFSLYLMSYFGLLYLANLFSFSF